ncbi:HAD family hydrolase [Companilactobacillus baiquanensis]|uniref:HAD family hydrolase n=1 Tax=Companilactobacillus baiquanensis TaxID=2486005 RepID=A0ABW1UVT4_9LACO|nr:HAD family hydrolase [Companilactobacillus baiquanensis]
MLKNILFDIDGTITDTEYTIIKSLQALLLREKGLTVKDEDLYYILGIPGEDGMRKFADNEADLNDLLEKWRIMIAEYANYSTVFDGMENLLQNLNNHNLNLGIITSKTKQELKNDFSRFNLNKYFDIFVTASDTKKHKPNPDPIFKALELLDAKADDSIYVGDSIYDMRCAHGANLPFALATWGAKSNPEFEQAEYKLTVPDSLMQIIF